MTDMENGAGGASAALGNNSAGKQSIKPLTTTELFEVFHQANPQVYAVMVRLAREYRARHAGVECGINLLAGRVRWEFSMTITSDDEFKLNDHHMPFYARLIMGRETDLAGIFELRRSVADAWSASYGGPVSDSFLRAVQHA
jgi:hypothetical protein